MSPDTGLRLALAQINPTVGAVAEPTDTFDITSQLSPDLQAQVPAEARVGRSAPQHVVGAPDRVIDRDLVPDVWDMADHGALIAACVIVWVSSALVSGFMVLFSLVTALVMRALADTMTGRTESARARRVEAAALVDGLSDRDLALRLDAAVHLGFPRHMAHDLVIETLEALLGLPQVVLAHPAEQVRLYRAEQGVAVSPHVFFGRVHEDLDDLGVDHRAIDVGEDLEDRADADVVAVGTDAVGDGAGAFDVFFERLDADELADLRVAKDAHDVLTPRTWGDRRPAGGASTRPSLAVESPGCRKPSSS